MLGFDSQAVTLQERTHEHKPSRIGVNKPIGVGFGYSTIAYVPEDQGSWTLPLLHERINSSETAISKLSEQLTQVCPQLDIDFHGTKRPKDFRSESRPKIE